MVEKFGLPKNQKEAERKRKFVAEYSVRHKDFADNDVEWLTDIREVEAVSATEAEKLAKKMERELGYNDGTASREYTLKKVFPGRVVSKTVGEGLAARIHFVAVPEGKK